MGLFGDKNAGRRAATEANRMTQLGIDELFPFLKAGQDQLPGQTQGTTAGGLDARLADILNTDTFGALTGERERAVRGQLSAGGLTRSGTAVESIANIPTELALQLENLLSGRSSALAGQGLGAAGGIANLFSQQGENTSSGIITDAETKASFGSNLAKVAGQIFFASDERLKTNIVQIGKIGPLPLYEWDWIPEAEGTAIWDCPRVGFMAGEVKEEYPDLVGEISGGWKVVNYGELGRVLQSDLDQKIALESEAA